MLDTRLVCLAAGWGGGVGVGAGSALTALIAELRGLRVSHPAGGMAGGEYESRVTPCSPLHLPGIAWAPGWYGAGLG